MFRLTSLFAFACLTLAATAFLTQAKSLPQDCPQRENDGNTAVRNRLTGALPEHTVYFHARFSLN